MALQQHGKLCAHTERCDNHRRRADGPAEDRAPCSQAPSPVRAASLELSQGELPAHFMNSTIEQLARSIDAYGDYARIVRRAADEAAARAIVGDLKQTLARIDPSAVADQEAWWTLVIELRKRAASFFAVLNP